MHSAAELGIKYLQIFNSRLVLASPETATDADYAAIEGVIGHEVSKHFSLHLCFCCQCVMEVFTCFATDFLILQVKFSLM